jgi:hypothetical protein
MVACVTRMALLLSLALPLFSGAAGAATKVAPVNAKVAKPLTLTRVQDLDLGRVILGPGTWSAAAVSISRDGVFVCNNPNVTCTGTPKVATFNMTGSNNQVVKVIAPTVTLTNQGDPSQTLTLVLDSPAMVTMETSGNKGQDFSIGGSMSLSSTTPGGLYTGTINVTVDY